MNLQPREKQFEALKDKAHNFVNRSPQPCRPVLHSGQTRNDSARVQPAKTSDRETREGRRRRHRREGLRTATATREDRRRRTGGGLLDTSYDGTDRARRCRFQGCSLAFQPFLRARAVPYFLTQTAVYLTALGSQNFSPAWSATSLVIGPLVTGESGFMMNPGCLIFWFGPNPAGENGDD